MVKMGGVYNTIFYNTA